MEVLFMHMENVEIILMISRMYEDPCVVELRGGVVIHPRVL